MPYIEAKLSVSLPRDAEERIKAELGRAIGLIPGKSERWLMIDFSDNRRLWFGGTSEPAAIVEVKLFGAAKDEAYDSLTAAVTEIIAKETAVAPERIYVKYDEVEHWGWNSENF